MVEDETLSFVAPYVRHVLEEAALAYPPSRTNSPNLPNGVTRHARKSSASDAVARPKNDEIDDPVTAVVQQVTLSPILSPQRLKTCSPEDGRPAGGYTMAAQLLSPQRAELRGDCLQAGKLPPALASPDLASPPAPPAQDMGGTPTPPGADGGAVAAPPGGGLELFAGGGGERPASGAGGRRRRRGPLAHVPGGGVRDSGERDGAHGGGGGVSKGHGFDEPPLGVV